MSSCFDVSSFPRVLVSVSCLYFIQGCSGARNVRPADSSYSEENSGWVGVLGAGADGGLPLPDHETFSKRSSALLEMITSTRGSSLASSRTQVSSQRGFTNDQNIKDLMRQYALAVVDGYSPVKQQCDAKTPKYDSMLTVLKERAEADRGLTNIKWRDLDKECLMIFGLGRNPRTGGFF